jgi:hypothetical protein
MAGDDASAAAATRGHAAMAQRDTVVCSLLLSPGGPVDMSKAPLYSRSRRHPAAEKAPAPRPPRRPPGAGAAGPAAAGPWPAGAHPACGWRRATRPAGGPGRRLFATLAMLLVLGVRPGQRVITQDDIDPPCAQSLEKEPLPSAAAKAYEAIAPSVVRVVGLMDEKDDGEERTPSSARWSAAWAPAW